MSIMVTCPNGHTLKVKSEFAGKSGLCPHCKAVIVVPKPEPVLSEDDLLDALGDADGAPHAPRVEKSFVHPMENQEASSGSAFLRRKKVCPKCCEIVSILQPACPRCRTPLAEWTFPMPDEEPEPEGVRILYRYLGVVQQGDVIVVRFDEHRILNELTVKKLGDELFRVADRSDCHNLLLNFTGVVGLCSAMLAILLLLRKKMNQKPGKLRLCMVGPEIMDVFNTTKLGQIFEILDSEQLGLKAFA